MDMLTRMSRALAYVEDNLAGEIDQQELARIACCSAYNFYRMFSFITDVSLTEYIRWRRLTLAAVELQNSGAQSKLRRAVNLACQNGNRKEINTLNLFIQF